MARYFARLAVFACGIGACSAAPRAGFERVDSRERLVVHRSDVRAQPPSFDAGRASDVDADGDAATHGEQRDPSILLGDVINARDLGGIPVANGGVVASGVLFRGPPLSDLTAQGCSDVAALAIHSVIDLRVESERVAQPEADCIARSARLVLAPLPVPYNVSPTDYIADLDSSESIATAFRALGDDAAYPLYFHCTYGRDRTGVLAAVILLALGATPDAIMRDYLLSQPNVGAYPESLDAVLREIDRRGGIAAYLRAAGVTDADVATLRAHAIVQ